MTHNIYFSNITINYDNLSSLPEGDHITNIPSVSVPYDNEESELFANAPEDPNLCVIGLANKVTPDV